MSEENTRRRLLGNALLLTAVSLLLRTAGLAYRASVTARVGLEGMGLYTLVQTAFVFAATISTAGLSTAVTCVTSENRSTGRGSRHVVLRALLYAVPLGTAAGLGLYLGARVISVHFLADARASTALRVLAPSLPLMSAAAVLKGYFYARREAALPAAADVLELTVEMLVFLALSTRWQIREPEAGCAAIALGTSLSELASCAFLSIACLLRRRTETGVRTPVLRRFLRIASRRRNCLTCWPWSSGRREN